MGNILEILKILKESSRFSSRIEHIETIEKKQGAYGNLGGIPEDIKKYLTQKKIRLYKHQTQCIKKIREGRNVIITTPTASGKTLAFNLPVFEALRQNNNYTALYLYPTKALANDQLKKIREVENITKIKVNADIYDGDTPSSRRPRIRNNSRIIISNPYEIHHILSWHYKWNNFFGNLKFIVIDEAHHYRGVFGSNIAMLFRRMERILDSYNANPQYVLSTATLANPAEFGKKLVGKDFDIIKKDCSPGGRKYFILYNPYFDGVGYYSTHQETRDLFTIMVKKGLQVLCFTISRKLAELTVNWAKEELGKLAGKVTCYRAGYLPEERREIESGLKSGKISGLVSTNALELGIDIGELDVVLISGYPGTLISTWQQAGRAGRGTNDSLVVFVGFQNALDQYLMKHSNYIFATPSENAVIDLSNPYIIAGHLMCASSELPVDAGRDSKFFGKKIEDYINDFAGNNLMKKTGNGWIYFGAKKPSQIVNLENIAGETFKILENGRVLETMSKVQAYREAHKGAVLLHRGEKYVVKDMDLVNLLIHLEKKNVDYYTDALKTVEVKVLEKERTKNIKGWELNYGSLKVEENFFAYKIKKYDKVLASEKLDLPPLEFNTVGLWFTIPEPIKAKVLDRNLDFEGGIHGIEHAMIAMMPLIVMCDRWDIGGVSYSSHPFNRKAAVFIYDSYEGGIGLSEKAFYLFPKLVKITNELVRDCNCSSGCPSCIYSPKCGNENKPLDKEASKIILEELKNLL
ncbi:MAG: DEAD/DEAH box helicase [Candidatus Humimicrobiaceae bacterium]